MNLDLYCERVFPGVWQEPVNTLSNAAFFLSAWFSLRFAKKQGHLSREAGILIFLIAGIAAGSTIFHNFGTRFTVLFDIVPILLFQLAFLIFYLRQVGGCSRGQAASAVCGFFGLAAVSRVLPQLPLGSSAYLPAFFLLLILGLFAALSRNRSRLTLLLASGVFLVSILFRAADAAVCPYFPIGTHFLWHLLNGIVLYLAMRAYLEDSPKSARS